MKHVVLILAYILLGALAAILIMTKPSAEVPGVVCTTDAHICPDGSAVGRTGPECTFAPCPDSIIPSDTEPRILVDSLQPGDTISSPLTITGRARGGWYFEASFPITIVNWNGLIIGNGYAMAQDEWMTSEFVPFVGVIEYDIPYDTPYARGAVILHKDNPSGLPEHDAAIEIPIIFSEIQKITTDE